MIDSSTDDQNRNVKEPLLGTAWLESQLNSYSSSTSSDHQSNHPYNNRTDQRNDESFQNSQDFSLPDRSICLNLSEFRKHLQSYRKLDDSITINLNKSIIIFRESKDRNHSSSSKTFDVDCEKFWRLLNESWLNREKLIKSCIEVFDESLKLKNHSIRSLSSSSSETAVPGNTSRTTSVTKTISSNSNGGGRINDDEEEDLLLKLQRMRSLESEAYTENLKRRMIHDELSVESAIKKQSLQKFQSICSPSIFKIPTTTTKTKD